jgi:hypothetical protein
MYRVSNGLKPLRMEMSFKDSCVDWAKRTSDSYVNQDTCFYRHTKTNNYEVICGANFCFDPNNPNMFKFFLSGGVVTAYDRETHKLLFKYTSPSKNVTLKEFSDFVMGVCGKKLVDLPKTDLMVLSLLYSWNQSKPHKEAILDPKQVKAYSATYYNFTSQFKGKYSSHFNSSAMGIIQLNQ